MLYIHVLRLIVGASHVWRMITDVAVILVAIQTESFLLMRCGRHVLALALSRALGLRYREFGNLYPLAIIAICVNATLHKLLEHGSLLFGQNFLSLVGFLLLRRIVHYK